MRGDGRRLEVVKPAALISKLLLHVAGVGVADAGAGGPQEDQHALDCSDGRRAGPQTQQRVPSLPQQLRPSSPESGLPSARACARPRHSLIVTCPSSVERTRRRATRTLRAVTTAGWKESLSASSETGLHSSCALWMMPSSWVGAREGRREGVNWHGTQHALSRQLAAGHTRPPQFGTQPRTRQRLLCRCCPSRLSSAPCCLPASHLFDVAHVGRPRLTVGLTGKVWRPVGHEDWAGGIRGDGHGAGCTVPLPSPQHPLPSSAAAVLGGQQCGGNRLRSSHVGGAAVRRWSAATSRSRPQQLRPSQPPSTRLSALKGAVKYLNMLSSWTSREPPSCNSSGATMPRPMRSVRRKWSGKRSSGSTVGNGARWSWCWV